MTASSFRRRLAATAGANPPARVHVPVRLVQVTDLLVLGALGTGPIVVLLAVVRAMGSRHRTEFLTAAVAASVVALVVNARGRAVRVPRAV